MLDQAIHFSPYLKSVIWGGERLASYKGVATDQSSIGESWEISAVPGHVSVVDRGELKGKSLTELISIYGAELVGADIYKKYGENFPLLIKLIDARDDLSVQVHPDDAISPYEYERRVADNTIMDVICAYDSAPGDTFFLPAGRIHAIGAGNLLAEIQETSDITYRIYDYDRRDKDGNPRQLHTEGARDAIDYRVYPSYMSEPVDSVLADCEYFVVRKYEVGGKPVVDYAVDAEAPRRSVTIGQGDTWLFPAVIRSIKVEGEGEILSVNA